MANMFAKYVTPEQGQNTAPTSGGNDYGQIMENAGATHGIPSGLMTQLMGKESSGNPSAVSSKGALGLGQVMPATAQEMGYDPQQLANDPQMQADASARYLRQMYDRYGDWGTALQAYHDGPGNTDAALKGQYTPGPEGQQYVDERFNQWTQGNQPAGEPQQRAQAARKVSAGNMFGQYATGESSPQQPAAQPDQPTQPAAAPQPTVEQASAASGGPAQGDQAAAWAAVMPGYFTAPQATPAGQQQAAAPQATQPQGQAPATQQNAAQEPQRGGMYDQVSAGGIADTIADTFNAAGEGAAKAGRAIINAGVDIARPIWNWAADSAESQANSALPQGVPRTVLPRIDKNQDKAISSLENMIGAQPGSLHTQGVGEEVAAQILPYFVGPGEIKALERVPGAARFVVNSLLRNAVGSAAEAAKTDDALTQFAKNEGLGLAGDTAFKALGKVLKPVWEGSKTMLGFGAKTGSAEEKIAEQAGKAAKGGEVTLPTDLQGGTATGTRSQAAIADEIDADQKVLAAARRLGMEDQLAPSSYTQNRQTREVLGALQSVTGSEMSAQNAKQISRLADEADALISISGGTKNKVALSEEFKNTAQKKIDELADQAEKVYSSIAEKIPKGADVQANNTVDYLLQKADDMRGTENLHPIERKVLDALNPKGEKLPDGTFAAPKPASYALLDQMRKDVGEALYKNTGPFQNAGQGRLSQLYKQLSQDQEEAAAGFGAESIWNVGKKLVAQRKALEDSFTRVMGQSGAEQAAVKYGSAIQKLQTGDSKAWDQLLADTPKEMRQKMVASALGDVFTKRSQKEGSLHVPGFVDWYNGARQSGTLGKVMKELPKEERQRLVNIATVANGIRRGNEFNLSTGKLNGFIKRFNDADGPLGRIFGSSLVGAASVLPGGAVVAHMGVQAAEAAKRARTARVDAADALLSDPKFLDLVKGAAFRDANRTSIQDAIRAGTATPEQLAAEQAIKKAERQINGLPAWQKLRATLPKAERALISKYGPAGWLAGYGKSEAARQSGESEE